LFFVGSRSGVTVICGGVLVASTVRTAPFHVPNTASGAIGVPPNCQSPARLLGSSVMSVMKSAGNSGPIAQIGNPAHEEVSVPA